MLEDIELAAIMGHGAGKIPLMPNYLVSASENAVILRNRDFAEE